MADTSINITINASDLTKTRDTIKSLSEAVERARARLASKEKKEVSGEPKPLLHLDQATPDRDKIKVRHNGYYTPHIYIEVDVLGCWAIRVSQDSRGFNMLDDDGYHMHEKVYGTFTLEKSTVSSDQDYFGYSIPPFA